MLENGLPEVIKGDDPKKPYGNVDYADPGYQEDGVYRYPLDTEAHIRAAWNYINQGRNASKYTPSQLAKVKSRIIRAWKEKIDPSGPPSAEDKALDFKMVALSKGLELPDDNGFVSFKSVPTNNPIVGEGAIDNKALSMEPNDEEMALLKQYAPHNDGHYMILRNVDPIGDPKAIDAQQETILPTAVKDLIDQAPGTPVLLSHDHDMMPSVGFCIAAKSSKGGIKETWAIPVETYNADIRRSIINGSSRQISIGALVKYADKICSSCNKSIYNQACPHTPGTQDEKGNVVSVGLKRIHRYAERSLVNCPARLGTAVKSLTILEESAQVLDFSTAEEAKNNNPDTIADVIDTSIEDSIVAKNPTPDNKEAPEAQVPEVQAPETVETEKEAPKIEDQAPEVKEFPSVDEIKEAVKSILPEPKEIDMEALKAIADNSELKAALTQQTEKMNVMAETIADLAKLHKELAQAVAEAMQLSSQETLEKLIEVADQLKSATAKEQKPLSPDDVISKALTLIPPKQ